MSPIEVIEDYRLLVPNDPAQLDEIVRQAEARLKMQVEVALAADARAGVIASLYGAGAIALFVAGAKDLTGAALWSAVAAGTLLIIGAACAAFAASPIAFGMIGTHPSDWLESVRDCETLVVGKAGYAVWLDKYLKLNDRQMATNNNWLRGALVVGVIAPAFAGLIALLAR